MTLEPHADLFARLERLNAIGAALSSERNMDRLLERILEEAQRITRADAGTLYVPTEDVRHLRFAIVRNASLGLALGGPDGAPLSDRFPDVPLYEADETPNHRMVAAHCALTGRTVSIAEVDDAAGFDFSGTHAFDARTGYRSRSFLTVPMKDHEGELIGVFQLINATAPDTGAVRAFSDADRRLAESLASQAAVALSNRRLIVQLETLFESFVQVINIAIDEKSHYTGGHCQRVPALTMMLAEAAHETTTGPLAGFRMTDADRHELKIAGLLHDCGKVTTPVHVVDKATKLETLADRIQVLDTRFEVLKRDAEVRMWQDIANGAPEQVARERLEAAWAGIDDDRAFLRQCNVGVEAMPPEDVERVRAISANRRWRDIAGNETDFLTDDELENLTIRSGTLTRAERDQVNHHIVATIRMLESLPWPRHLRHVPEYAGGHHERVDGRGYPRGLTGDQMSVSARILAIADIFEALTARDRPYKPGMSLSQALRVMADLRDRGHIDPDLFRVFEDRGVFARYARHYLDRSQIDVDLDDTA
jgi:HD-GYP domain-containing protein (c-di-GMP phosphodiesterase class II)